MDKLRAYLQEDKTYKVDTSIIEVFLKRKPSLEIDNLIEGIINFIIEEGSNKKLEDYFVDIAVMSLDYLKIENKIDENKNIVVKASVFIQKENGDIKEEIRDLIIDPESTTFNLIDASRHKKSDLCLSLYELLYSQDLQIKDSENMEMIVEKTPQIENTMVDRLIGNIDKNKEYQIDYSSLEKEFQKKSQEELSFFTNEMINYLQIEHPKQDLNNVYTDLTIMSLDYLKIKNKIDENKNITVEVSSLIEHENGSIKKSVKQVIIDPKRISDILYHSCKATGNYSCALKLANLLEAKHKEEENKKNKSVKAFK